MVWWFHTLMTPSWSLWRNMGEKKLIGLCTDGVPAMIGVQSGLAKKLKEKDYAMVSTHCVIHLQALASKTLPQKLRQTLYSAIRIVNYNKSSALNSRLFTLLARISILITKFFCSTQKYAGCPKATCLDRLYKLKEEALFLESKEKHDFLMFKNYTFQWRLAYLTDIFDSLNEPNLKLQSRNNIIISNYGYIQGSYQSFNFGIKKCLLIMLYVFLGCLKQLKITYWTQIKKLICNAGRRIAPILSRHQ
ncbi:unnamed protein product [Acanthoscelides obtectus]|uniref:Uncharacterized protein n=1 Tax=Acanthoscelides obtectus TaxID=200917 RepID=A0A9P0K8P9_ACAOB|nr:unnamed protein product [Acanthoscelides obtectus]CAK1682733.1 Protein FAM200B [Acanthoscelides obtectus]